MSWWCVEAAPRGTARSYGIMLLSAQAAETGSGKTGAFALPALQLVHELRQAEAARPKSADSAGAPRGAAAAGA